ncbi:alkaline phosphatase D family protein [Pontiellaceae bacterium B1224]|nr:alkaline phosphatase D family protein [Pontiellaceae bacterium B1224]
MTDCTNFKRRHFLVLTGATVGGALTARAAKPKDPRFVSLKEAHQGTLEIDLRIMNQFQTQPQDVQDFYTRCRVAFTGRNPDVELPKICREFKRRTLGGPMLGQLSTDSVAVWVHLPEPEAISVEVVPTAGGKPAVFKAEKSERVVSVLCDGLSADREYHYAVLNSKKQKLGAGTFTTAPAKLSADPFKIAFGTCFHKIGLHRPELMSLIKERDNRAMLILGDSALDGRRDRYGEVYSDYLLRNLSPAWQKMSTNVPIYSAWDDHDYWGDDMGGKTTKQGSPINVDWVRAKWNEQWNNPERDGGRAGIYFDTQIGPVHAIVLDTRSCRVNDERGKKNSYLGKEQMDWLKKTLKKSTAPFILLTSGTMWGDHISNGKDSWGTWDTDGREEVFQCIDAKEGSQVILLSGDRHGARGYAHPRPNGKKIYELEAATMGGVPGPGAYGKDRNEQLFGYPGGTWAFGEFTFEQKNGKPLATFRLIGVDGREMETITLDA